MVMEKASELGLAISNSGEFKRMQAAKAAMDMDKRMLELMEQYSSGQERMVEMLQKPEPDGLAVSALAKELDDIQNELAVDPLFTEFMESQQGFALLMRQVNRIIGAYIGLQSSDNKSEGGCAGNCSGCSGCIH